MHLTNFREETIQIKIMISHDDVKRFEKVLFIISINNDTEPNNLDEIQLNLSIPDLIAPIPNVLSASNR